MPSNRLRPPLQLNQAHAAGVGLSAGAGHDDDDSDGEEVTIAVLTAQLQEAKQLLAMERAHDPLPQVRGEQGSAGL